MEADGVTVYIDRALDHGTDASYRLPLSRFLRHRYLEVSFEGR